MKIVKHMDPEIWEARAGGGVVAAIFGILFMGAGVLIAVSFLGLIPMEGNKPPALLIIPFALAFFLPGLVVAAGRIGLKIDRRAGKVIKWYGVMVPMKKTEFPLAAFGRVFLTKEIRKGNKSSVTLYPVYIDSKEDIKPIQIDAPLDYNEARRLSERMAKFLRAPIMDNSSGEEVMRELDNLDESLRDRLKRTGEEIPDLSPPPAMKSAVREESGLLKIDIPPRGYSPFHLFFLVPMLIFDAIVFFVFIMPMLSDGDWQIAIVAGLFFIAVPIVFLGLNILPMAKTSYRIEASAEKLLVVEKKPFGKRTYEIRSDELEELVLSEKALPAGMNAQMGRKQQPGAALLNVVARFAPGGEIIARCDRVNVSFGKGLDTRELKYIHNVVMRRLTS